ncbi:MAG: hypothetical protein QXX20_00455 [Candidatus Thermoplasmatota archaeon]
MGCTRKLPAHSFQALKLTRVLIIFFAAMILASNACSYAVKPVSLRAFH